MPSSSCMCPAKHPTWADGQAQTVRQVSTWLFFSPPQSFPSPGPHRQRSVPMSHDNRMGQSLDTPAPPPGQSAPCWEGPLFPPRGPPLQSEGSPAASPPRGLASHWAGPAQAQALEAGRAGLSPSCCLEAVSPRASDQTFLGLGVLLCKMGVVDTCISRQEDEMS